MGQRHRKREPAEPEPWAGDDSIPVRDPCPMVIVGAGTLLSSLIRLVREHPEFKLAGILDPSPTLRGQIINDLPVLGWLESLPSPAAAVIGNAGGAQGFDREAVFRILGRQGIALPILAASTSYCAPDVTLCRGAILLPGAIVERGAAIGENCLIGDGATVRSFASVPDHTLLAPGTKAEPMKEAGAQPMAPKSLAATLASATDSIQEILRRINWANMEIVLVVNEQGALLGTITDGDIRRGILAGVDTRQPVSLIMNRAPITVPIGAPYEEMLTIMKSRSIRHLPVVDAGNRPVRLERLENLVEQMTGQGAVVMAGGLGSRLRPLTDDTPKPLLSVAGRPILDRILEGLKQGGIDDVVISVNYLGHRIREHVGDGQGHKLNVNYIAEKERLGTAGALSLIKPRPRRPFLVMNGDLLTRLNFARLLQFQQDHRHTLAMCVRRHQVQVPYGVVEIRDGRVSALKEKPAYEHFINAGIYVLDPACLDFIPRNRYFDMTDLIQTLLDHGRSVGAFPIIEYWRDIGNPEDLCAAGREQLAHELAPSIEDPCIGVPMEALG